MRQYIRAGIFSAHMGRSTVVHASYQHDCRLYNEVAVYYDI